MTTDREASVRDICWSELVAILAAEGTEAEATGEPRADSPYHKPPLSCPHGFRYWVYPTAAQVAKWTAEGTA